MKQADAAIWERYFGFQTVDEFVMCSSGDAHQALDGFLNVEPASAWLETEFGPDAIKKALHRHLCRYLIVSLE